jgi:4,5-dihydroxyphthalate decarboxylase
MGKIALSIATGDYDRVRPLATGAVQIDGVDPTFALLTPEEMFFRAFRHGDFDVSELSLSSYVLKVARGDCPYIAIPTFPSRAFRHNSIFIRNDRGISTPADLRGRRIGVPEYQLTANVWARMILETDYGVKPSDIIWVRGGEETPGRIEKIKIELPANIRIEEAPEGSTLSQLLAEGKIDGLIGPRAPSSFDAGHPNISWLFPDPASASLDWYSRTKIFPIMHVLAIRRELYEKHPFIATSLYNAACESRAIGIAKARDVGALRYMLPWMVADFHEIDEVFGNEFWPYGVEENRPTLEALVTYLHDQAMIPRKVLIEELFVPTYGYPNIGEHRSGREGWTTTRAS